MCPMQEWEPHYFKFIFQYIESFRYLQNFWSKIRHSLQLQIHRSPAKLTFVPMLNVSRQRKCSGSAQSAASEHRNHRLDSNDLCRLTWRHFNIFIIQNRVFCPVLGTVRILWVVTMQCSQHKTLLKCCTCLPGLWKPSDLHFLQTSSRTNWHLNRRQ